ncbi:GNAT family N-acetyltransferase [Aquimarina pacifica]|uniref:GNAT family N-acetyltransferase n=1 Tax=Aquimarina pacifica TaxID=1296415 RepID=UPI0004B30257|nr:GNAT family N-acetyltransferase [Aquimarina pacifica]
MIFETERLLVRRLKNTDASDFYELMRDPEVMHPIPRKTLSRKKSDLRLKELIELEQKSDTNIWGFTKKSRSEIIGICGFLKNNKNEEEIAYSIAQKFWGKGYGTEIAKGLIDFSFDVRKTSKVTADVNIENDKSVKILEKIMTPSFEFYNIKDDCIDRRYQIKKEHWYRLYKS